MRIDLNYGPQSVPESERAQSQGAAASSSNRASLGDDQAQISAAHVQAQALTAQALQLPEIRQQRVEVLRQVVLAGQYHPQPESVAGAMIAHMASGESASSQLA